MQEKKRRKKILRPLIDAKMENEKEENKRSERELNKPQSSAFARGDGEVHIVPMSVIRRPLPSELDEDKVLAFMEEMKVWACWRLHD